MLIDSNTVDSSSESDSDGSDSVFHEINSSWGWALYLNRAPISEQRGNLNVSANLNIARRGFLITVFDPRTYRESYRFFNYRDVLPLLSKTLDDFEEILGNIDESVASDLLNEILSLIEIQTHPAEGLVLVLGPADFPHSNINSDSVDNDLENPQQILVVARLVDIPITIPKNVRSKSKATELPTKLTVRIGKIEELSKLESFGGRNSYCIIRHNMREISRTTIKRNTLNPDWSDETKGSIVEVLLQKENMLRTVCIDIEVYDTDAHGQTTDFLGMVKLYGPNLFKLLEIPSIDDANGNITFTVLSLEKSKKLSESDNQYVNGKIHISAAISTDTNTGNASSSAVLKQIVGETEELVVQSNSMDLGSLGFKYFYLYVTDVVMQSSFAYTSLKNDAIRLGNNSLVVVVLYFNGHELHRYDSTVSNLFIDYNESTIKILFDSLRPIECRVPVNYPIGGCTIRLELLLFETQQLREKNIFKLLGFFELSGESLKQFLKENAANNNFSPKICVPRSHSSPTEFQPKLSIFSTISGAMYESYKVKVLSARNLPKADLFGKSDPFVKIYFNSTFIGQTSHQTKTLNPNWSNLNEEFSLLVPIHISIDECILEFHVYDRDNMTDHELLGVATITGQMLHHVLTSFDQIRSSAELQKISKEGGCEFNSNSNSYQIPLRKSVYLKQKVQAKGDIEIKVVNKFVSKKPIEVLNRYHDFETYQFVDQEENLQIIADELNAVHPLESFMFYTKRTRYQIFVSQAMNLAALNTFENSFRYAVIYFNGKVIGVTKEIKNSMEPLWNDSFQIQLCPNQNIKHCMFRVEVFEHSSNENATFLGGLDIEGINIIIGTERRKFSLEKSRKGYDNRKVQGSISLSFVELLELDNKLDSNESDKLQEIHLEEPTNADSGTIDISLAVDSCRIKVENDSTTNKVVLNNVVLLVVILNGEIWHRYFGSIKESGTFSDIEWCLPSQKVSLPNIVISIPSNIPISQHVFQLMFYIVPRDSIHLYANAIYEAWSIWSSLNLIGSCYFSGSNLEQVFSQVADTYPSAKRFEFQISQLPFFSTSFLHSSPRSRISFEITKVPMTAKAAIYSIPQNHHHGFNSGRFVIVRTDLSGETLDWIHRFEDPIQQSVQNQTIRANVDTTQAHFPTLVSSANNHQKGGEKKKYIVENPAMNFAVTIKLRVQDEHRIFWRGKIMPKQVIFGNEKKRHEILASRASRLIETQSLEKMEVFADVHYLVDYGDAVTVNEDLPVCVREIIQDGPGLIQRYFRVELMSNAGTVLGTADISDTDDDLMKVVGSSFGNLQNLKQLRSEGNLSEVFEYIVRDRLVLDTTIGEDLSSVNKEVVPSADDNENQNFNSIIYLLREKLNEVVTNSLSENYYEDIIVRNTEADNNTQTSDSQQLNILHILSRNQRVVGKSFRTTIYLASESPALITSTNSYFKQFQTLPDCLQELTVIFKCKDVVTKTIHELKLSGKSIATWLPLEFPFSDIGTKFRRSKFGLHMSGYVTLKFQDDGGFHFEFLRLSN